MNKLEVGMYVRYKTLSNQINIAKIIDIDSKKILELDNKDYTHEKYFIGEPSFDIIDLVQVGDYVNGHRVNYINKDRKHFNISFGDEDFNLKSKFNSDIYWLSKEDIKSIVTKEQFERAKYEVE